MQFLEGHLEAERKQVAVLSDETAKLEGELADANSRNTLYESGVYGLPQVRRQGWVDTCDSTVSKTQTTWQMTIDEQILGIVEVCRQALDAVELVVSVAPRLTGCCCFYGTGCYGDQAAEGGGCKWGCKSEGAGATGMSDYTPIKLQLVGMDSLLNWLSLELLCSKFSTLATNKSSRVYAALPMVTLQAPVLAGQQVICCS